MRLALGDVSDVGRIRRSHLEVSLSTGTGNNKKIGDGRWKHVSTRHFHLHPTAVAALVQGGRTGEGIQLAELPHSSLMLKLLFGQRLQATTPGSDYWRACYQFFWLFISVSYTKVSRFLPQEVKMAET
jgi:hypothetical protein